MSAFLRDEDGGATTIEALLWIPFLLSIVLLALDLSVVSTKQAMVMRIVQDGNRGYAMGRYTTAQQTAEAVRRSVLRISPSARVVSTVSTASVAGSTAVTTITTSVRMRAEELSPIGILPNWGEQYVGVQAQHTKEF